MLIHFGIQKSSRESVNKEYLEFHPLYPSLALVQPEDPDKSATLFPFFSSPQKIMTTPLFQNSRKIQPYNFLSLN